MTGKMWKGRSARLFAPIMLLSFFMVLPVYSLLLKPNALINLNWKFTQGNPANAQDTGFNDAGWKTVGIPHSASYDSPLYSSEKNHYQGDSWYRKTFLCPAEAKKVLIHFEGAMQTTTLYVNGSLVGMHDIGGYTGFAFDISKYLIRGKNNLIACKINITYDLNIPPGGKGTDQVPDFFLFSGLYRNVWLQFKDSVYIPNRGQQITTPGTSTSAAARIVTKVNNDAPAAKSVTITHTLKSPSGASVGTQTDTKSIPAGSSLVFDLSTDKITPQCWSPTTPNLYSVQTLVSVGGAVVDSMVEKIGFRFYSWTATAPGGFSINGTRTEIKGVCLHQFMGWIENAVPDSRFALQVAMIKNLGCNSIRCSHYPRAKAFYDACDSMGMLIYVEVPSWSVYGGFPGRTAFWNRIYSTDTAMVLDGYNHPCIYAWGMFNEPSETGLDSYFNNENTIIHNLDPLAVAGRVTAIANNKGWASKFKYDITALNYETSATGTNKGILNTETYMDWGRVFTRGNASDLDIGSTSQATKQVTEMVNGTVTTDACAGSHFWCFEDYNSWHSPTGLQGIVDKMFLPKNVFFMLRKAWTNQATDYWQNGTPTKIDLTADLTTLKADGSDISLVTANLRDASNVCVQPSAGCNITFTATPAGSVTLFPSSGTTSGNPVTVSAAGGRAAVLVKTNTTVGAITLTTTSSCGLPQATVNLTAKEVTENFYIIPSSVRKSPVSKLLNTATALQMVPSPKGFLFRSSSELNGTLRIVDLHGRVVVTRAISKGSSVFIDRNKIPRGNHIVKFSTSEGTEAYSKFINVN